MSSTPLPLFAPRPTATPAPACVPFLRMGFRPFYLGGAAAAMLIVPVWVASVLGVVNFTPAFPPLYWHAHEMLFGFAGAIIVGFLLTASHSWTGLTTPLGNALASLMALWVAARVTAVTGPYHVYAICDIALLPIVAVVLIRLLLRANNFRNLPIALILALLAFANGVFHAATLGWLLMTVFTPLHAGLALITIMECVIAGRIIPAFTMSAQPGVAIRVNPLFERFTIAHTCVGLALWVFAPLDSAFSRVACAVLLIAALLNVIRIALWKPWIARSKPILWILPASYAFVPLGLALLALACVGVVNASLGIHALAVGATGGLILGMMSRSARGHTGRAVHASKPEVLAFALVLVAALTRVMIPLIAPSSTSLALVVAAAAWSCAFLLFLVIFTPWLMRARADGKDG